MKAGCGRGTWAWERTESHHGELFPENGCGAQVSCVPLSVDVKSTRETGCGTPCLFVSGDAGQGTDCDAVSS